MKQRVFIAEDLQRMRELLIDLFSASGEFQVVGTACTEAEADRWLTANGESWDLAIIDMVLDEGSGSNVIRRAREQNYAGLIAVLSSCVTDNLREHCYVLGADKVFDEAQMTRFLLWLAKVGAGDAQVPPPAAATTGAALRA
jgi:two-component system, OmpR family, response regulator